MSKIDVICGTLLGVVAVISLVLSVVFYTATYQIHTGNECGWANRAAFYIDRELISGTQRHLDCKPKIQVIYYKIYPKGQIGEDPLSFARCSEVRQANMNPYNPKSCKPGTKMIIER